MQPTKYITKRRFALQFVSFLINLIYFKPMLDIQIDFFAHFLIHFVRAVYVCIAI